MENPGPVASDEVKVAGMGERVCVPGLVSGNGIAVSSVGNKESVSSSFVGFPRVVASIKPLRLDRNVKKYIWTCMMKVIMQLAIFGS